MKRYSHYWWPVSGTYAPSRIAVMDYDPADEASRKTASYSIVWSDLKGGVPISAASARGDTVDTIQDRISRFCVSRETTWIFSPRMGDCLSQIGFWESLENGHVTLLGKDWRGEGQTKCSGEGHPSGVCVIEDPPTVILCGCRAKPGKAVLLDTRNFGIGTSQLGGDCVTRTSRLLAGLCDCLHTLRTDRPTSLRCTAASQAVQSLRSNWPVRSLHCTADERPLRLVRQGYYSGRCEAYRIGTYRERLYHLDVRNMYPSLCLTLPVPVSLRCYHDDREGAERAVRSCPQDCVADVRIRCGVSRYPLRRGGVTIFPEGEFRTTLCGAELCEASRAGDVADVFTAAEYSCRPVLAGFYSYWLSKLSAARQEGKEILCAFIKSLMNALPGKFCEPGRRWLPVPHTGNVKPYDEWYQSGPDGELVRYRQIAWYTQREEISGESYHSIPSIGAFITAAGRSRIYGILQAAGRGNVLYVDTDGIITNEVGFDLLLRQGAIRDGEIGYLRLVGKSTGCSIYGIRDVRFGGNVTCSGVPKGGIVGGESRASYWQRQRIKTDVAMGRRPGTSAAGESVVPVEPYRHGVVGPDGTVSPFLLGV